jgi:hypothetical protein
LSTPRAPSAVVVAVDQFNGVLHFFLSGHVPVKRTCNARAIRTIRSPTPQKKTNKKNTHQIQMFNYQKETGVPVKRTGKDAAHVRLEI